MRRELSGRPAHLLKNRALFFVLDARRHDAYHGHKGYQARRFNRMGMAPRRILQQDPAHLLRGDAMNLARFCQFASSPVLTHQVQICCVNQRGGP